MQDDKAIDTFIKFVVSFMILGFWKFIEIIWWIIEHVRISLV